ncbi:MAG: CbaC protein [Halobacteriales archaeon]
MEKHLKFLIAAAVAVPVFVELRTFGGMLGVEVSLPIAVVVGIVVAAFVVLVDENVSFDRSKSL